MRSRSVGRAKRANGVPPGLFLPLLAAAILIAGCVSSPGKQPDAQEGSGVRGRVLLRSNGQPVNGAHVYAYLDNSRNLIGAADYVSLGTAQDGSFSLDLPPGKYYFVSRKRASGANYGPVSTGDLYDHRYKTEPVRIIGGKFETLEFHLVKLSEPMFFQMLTEAQRRTGTGIRGRILNEGGVPVQGAFATAYRTSDMKRLPDFVSTLSGDDGRFVLNLPEGGTWYIGARSHVRGVPKPGEPVGKYEGSKDNSVQVPQDAFLDGVDLTLRPFASNPPPGYQPY